MSIGTCTHCGAACPFCTPATGFTLMSLDYSVQRLVGEVLRQLGASQSAQDKLIISIMHIDPKYIKQACRIWNSKSYFKQGKGINYFKGICLQCAEDGPDRTLDSLPPMITEEIG